MKKVLFAMLAVTVALTACVKDPAAELTLGEDKATTASYDVTYAGEVIETVINANYPWTAAITGTCQVIVEPQQGEGGETVKITVPENLGEEKTEAQILFTCEGGGAKAELEVTIVQDVLKTVEYAGVTYKVKKLKDGNFWFVENLRVVPEGKTVTKDLEALDNGVWYPVDAKEKVLTDNADTVAKKGYLYSAEAALGLAPKTVTNDNYTTYEGKQGICPAGWHIPTLDELAGLVGRVAVTKYDLKADPGPVATAPYWDATAGAALISKANEDGFNIHNTTGYINAAATATKGTVLNVMNYILSSYGVTKAADNTFNNQFSGIMVAATNGGSCSGASFNYRGGASVRCVKDHK